MGNFEMRYPVHGSTALKPSSAEQSQSATIKEGTLRGVSHSDMKPSHAIACGVAMTIASFILFFL